MAKNLNMLKVHRTDIFTTEEEDQRSAEEERKRRIEKEMNVWDGQTTTVAITAQRNAAAAAAAAGGLSYGQEAAARDADSSIGPQMGHAHAAQPPLFHQSGSYNQTYRLQPGGLPPPPMPGMIPPPGMPGMPPPHFAPPPGMPPFYPGPPGLAPPPPPGAGLAAPPASANLPPRPAAPAPATAPGTSSPQVPAQTPPVGRHADENLSEQDRDNKRLKSEHNSPFPAAGSPAFSGPPATSSPSLPMGPNWITLDIQFAGSEDIKPEWNRDKLSTVTIENLVSGTMVSTLKDRIMAATGFPVGKQKLILSDGTITKNATTLGEYGFRIGQRGELKLAVKK